MNYTHEPAEKSTVKLTMTFNSEEWEQAIIKAYTKTRGKYTVPGFRKGKAPKSVLENYYGKGVFYEEALNVLYQEHYPQIVEKEKESFTVVGDPELSVDDLSDEKVVLSAVIPVKPDVAISAYKGLKIKKYEYNVTDEQVEAEVKKVAEKEAKDVEVIDRPCKDGDKVNINFSGSVDGEKFAGGTAEEYDLVLGSGSFIPGFEAQVVGMSVGGEKDITVKFPDDYQAENLKGKDAVFAIKLNKITEKSYPEITDELVKKYGGSETVDEYTQKTRKKLEDNAAKRSRDDTENSILAEICKNAECEIPDAMVETEIDGMVQEFSYRLMYQGLKLEEYLKYMGQELSDFRAQFRDQARNRVLSQLVISKIIDVEGIGVKPGQLDEKITEQAQSVGKTYEEYKENIDPRQVEYITNDIIITNLFTFLEENNEMVTE